MRTPKRNGSGGDFLSGLSHRRQDELVGAWGRKPLSHILRQARERRKLSLQEVARLTGIPVKYLYLLEGAGEKRLLAEPLSLISSLCRYAAFLNLNPDLVVMQFIAELEKLPPVEEETGGGARPTQLLKPLPQPRARVLPRTLLLPGLSH
jgi:cytoskeletal protein RodZ